MAAKFPIPDAALSQHIAVIGKTGSGKTYAAKSAVERFLDQKRQVCVIDPTGAWYGLRISANGKARGYDVVLLGGAHADIPLSEHSGPAVARLVTQQKASVIIDTSGMHVGEYTRWFIDFAGTLYTTIESPLHLVIDEAHYFMPQSGGVGKDPQAAKMLHAGNRLMSGGRSKGVRGMLITQRPAKLHKDSLTCADTLIALRVMAPQDRKAVKEWIDGAADPEQGRAVLDSLANLARGEGWVWYPEGAHLERTKFPPIKTYDSSATPEHGAKSGPQVGEINLEEVRSAMADAVREAEANDPKLLRKRIAELERQLKTAPTATKTVEVEKRVEVPVLKNGQLERTEKIGERMATVLDKAITEVSTLRQLISPAFAKPVAQPLQRKPLASPAAKRPQSIPKTIPTNVPQSDGDLAINATQQRILNALAWYESLGNSSPTATQVGAVALIDPTGGYFSNTIGPLSSAALVVRGNGVLSLTDAGRQLAEPIESPGTLADYHDVLRQRVRKMKSASGKTIEMLNAIIDQSGASITAEQLGQAVGIDHTGGYFSNTIGPLGTAGLIQRRAGMITPTDVLFPEALV